MGLGILLIRADAGPAIGTGHAMRCLALAQTWQDAGGNAAFVMAQSTPAVSARLDSERCRTILISAAPGSREDADITSSIARQNDAEWLVIDGYNFGASYQERISRGNWKSLCVDDEGHCEAYSVDVILNQNITASKNLYRNCGLQTRLALGTRFCLLRRDFLAWKDWQRAIPEQGRKLLVLLGGSTSEEIGIRVMDSLRLVDVEGFHATFLIGGSTPRTSLLERYAAQLSGKVSLMRDVSDVATLMSQADAALSAAGSTCWELCFLRLPSILLDLAPNQTPVAKKLHEAGCALYAGSANDIEPSKLAGVVQSLFQSSGLRESMSRRAGESVDGRGAERVVAMMRSYCPESSEARREGVHQ